jgi:glycosyltransferase involved in cell wall biosynthesis
MSGRSGLADTTTSMPSGAAATEQPALGTRAPGGARLAAKRAGMVVFSSYPADPRPRRAAAALLDEGMYIDLICEADDKSPRREALGGLAITRIPIRHIRGGALSYAYQYASFILISAAIFAWRSLRRRYDLIYVHNMPDILVVAALVPKLLGARVILDQHDPMPELMTTIFGMKEESLAMRVIRRLEKWSLARADQVITVNIACKRLFSNRGCPADKIGIVMNAPDDRIFPYREASSNPGRSAGEPFVVMYHGSLVERNGLELAIDALARLRGTMPEVQLYIYGRSTPYLEQMMEKVRTLGLEDSVRYLGGKTLEELVHEIDRCDLGVIPNPRNAFTEINTPTRIFEYLTLGKPVVAPRTSGIEDYFGAHSLLFFEPGNADDLARMIAYAVEHPQQTAACAARGQQVYKAHNWQQEKETLVNLVTNLLAAKPANG